MSQNDKTAVEKVFTTQEDLYAYWLELGGTAGWRESTTPEALTQTLATCTIKKVNAAIKQGEWVHKVQIVDESELTGYVSVLLSRLPKLTKLRIFACKTTWPFDFAEIDAVESPFPKLVHIGLIRTNWTEEQVTELTNRFPKLQQSYKYLNRGCGVGVYRENGPTTKEEELKAILKRNKKLQVLD